MLLQKLSYLVLSRALCHTLANLAICFSRFVVLPHILNQIQKSNITQVLDCNPAKDIDPPPPALFTNCLLTMHFVTLLRVEILCHTLCFRFFILFASFQCNSQKSKVAKHNEIPPLPKKQTHLQAMHFPTHDFILLH